MGKEEKKILFVTVGTSALTARLLGSGISQDSARLRQRCTAYVEDPDGQQRDEAELFTEVLEVHRAYWTRKAGGGQLEAEGTSAEMTSTSLLMRTDPEGERKPSERKLLGGFKKGRDHLALLASDTPEGQFCAKLNARLICEFLVGCKCNDNCETCEVVVWTGLEARDKEFQGIANKLREIVTDEKYSERTRFFNITGGYKAAIPAVTYLCWDLRPTVPIFNQHVSQSSVIRLQFVPGPAPGESHMKEEIIYAPET